MKKRLLLFTLLVSSFLAFSQDDASIPGTTQTKNTVSEDTKFFFTITAGPSIPTGDFGDNDLNSLTSGGAITGLHIGLDAGYIIKNGFGVALNLSGGSHFFDDSWFSDLSTWSYGNFLIGPMISTQSGKLIIEGHILGGRTALSYNLDLDDYTETATGFGLMVGGNLKVNLKGFLLSAGLDYLSSNPYFIDSDYEQPLNALLLKGGIGFAF